jgi:hypothetical protein
MKQLPENPQIYEINSRVWLAGLSRQVGHRITLSQIPPEEWERLRGLGMDLVWMMGVWLHSPQGVRIARSHSDLQGAYRQALPDFTPDDVIGSPYAVADYRLDPSLGAESDLSILRKNLHKAGLGLVLDFVPNHTARDHPWVRSHPERFVHTDSPQTFAPGESFEIRCADGRKRWIAHGRDPYFPPWTDTAQIFPLSPETRGEVGTLLRRIARLCDGLRCDMAMLVLNRVFERTWKGWMDAQDRRTPETEYWAEVLGSLKAEQPDFLLMAEVYWGLEPELLALGFDYVYDKAGYDRLRAFDVTGYRQGLADEGDGRSRRVRFLENHDEDRMAAVFPAGAFRSTAVLHATSPGLRLFHHGQLEGLRTRLPVQLGREPDEAPDTAAAAFYRRLLDITKEPIFKRGRADVLSVTPAFNGDEGFRSLVGFAYRHGREVGLAAVNQSDQTASGYLRFPQGFWEGWSRVELRERLVEPHEVYVREREDLEARGLYVRLEPFAFHLLTASRSEG